MQRCELIISYSLAPPELTEFTFLLTGINAFFLVFHCGMIEM